MKNRHLTAGARVLPDSRVGRGLVRTAFLLLACLWVPACNTVPARSAGDAAARSEVQQVMHRYLEAFNADDLETVAQSWQTPGWLSTSDSMNLLVDRQAVKDLYGSLLGKIRAEGYDHSELLSEDIRFINDRHVTYRITFTRWKKDGTFMPPRVRGSVCTMQKVDGQWGLSNVALEPGTRK